MSFTHDFTALTLTIGASLVLIILGLLYFVLTVWIIKIGAGFVGYEQLDGNWVVLAASVIATGSIVSSSVRR